MAQKQDQLEGLTTFVRVAQLANFSSAASHLGVSPSAVSQAIRQLEVRFGVALFHRTTRSVRLTEAGQQFYDRVAPLVEELGLATEALMDTSEEPAGPLRLNIPRAAWLTLLQPVLGEFMARYPKIDLELSLDGALSDIVRLGFDAGIRFADMVEKDMVAVPVGPPLSVYVIASPEYLARHGTPEHPRELLEHHCLSFRYASSGMLDRWEFQHGEEQLSLSVPSRLIINDSSALVQSAIDGHGIAYMLNGYIEPWLESGQLQRVLEPWSPRLPGYALYYPHRRRTSRRLQTLIAFLREQHWPATRSISALQL